MCVCNIISICVAEIILDNYVQVKNVIKQLGPTT